MEKHQRYFWISLLLVSGFRLFFIGHYELCPDEAYYWTWSQRLDWSYYDQGPMLALVIRLFTALSGAASEWSVRLGAWVLSLATAWMFFGLTRRMFGAKAAWYAFLAMQATVLFSAGAIMMMHDSIMMAAWVAGLFAFYRALVEDWQPGWLLGALALGLGGLSKYTVALFVPCLLLFIILSHRHRVYWRKPHLYAAGMLTVACVLPVFLWNAHHGWASFGHVGDLSGGAQAFRLSLKGLGDFFGGQLGVMTPLIGGFCLAAPWLARRELRPGRPQSETYLFLTCFSLPVLAFFALLSLKTSVYANWPAPAYPAALALFAGWLVKAEADPVTGRRVRAWWRVSLAVAVALTLLAHAEVGWGVLPLRGKAADSVDRIRGWREIGDHTRRLLDRLYREEPAAPVFLAARRYQLAGISSFYTPGHPWVQLLPQTPPVTNQYRFWDRSADLAGQNAVLVFEEDWELWAMGAYFERGVKETDKLTVTRRGRHIRDIRFALGYGFRRPPAGGGAQ